jgi:predicted regulator of Ras-like GTPase activity (Roadblock/LC7/MglB family)
MQRTVKNMLDTKDIDDILSRIIKSDPGMKKVILMDRTGLTIAHVSKFSYYPDDIDNIGAIASGIFCASETQGQSLYLGELLIVTSEFDGGKIFVASCGRGVLCLIADMEIDIGIARIMMKSAAEQLKEIIDEFLFDDPGDLGCGLNLSELDMVKQ